jgi:TPR repeat protein
MYASGAGTSIDAEQSFVWFHRAAELGSVDSMQEVGKALIAGYGTVQDPVQGERWLVSAAENGSVGAMYDLYSYHNLSGDPAAFDVAMGWLRKAADAGSAAAMFRLAQTLRNDPRLADRRDEATIWLERAAAAGHKGSRRLLDATAAKTAAVGSAG